MAERLNILAIAGILAAAGNGIGNVRPATASDSSDQGTTPSGIVEPLRQESGRRFINFNRGESVLGDTVVITTARGEQWRYNCFYPDAPRKGRVKYGVVDYSRADLRAAKRNDAVNCNNVTPRPGPRKETGDGSLPVNENAFAYGYYFQDADDGEVRYDVSVKPGDHPDGRIFYGVRNPRPGEAKEVGSLTSYDAANPRTGLREETGAGGVLTFGQGAEVYGLNIKLNDGRECNPADENGVRPFAGVEVVNATQSGIVESGVVNPPPQELEDVEFATCQP